MYFAMSFSIRTMEFAKVSISSPERMERLENFISVVVYRSAISDRLVIGRMIERFTIRIPNRLTITVTIPKITAAFSRKLFSRRTISSMEISTAA